MKRIYLLMLLFTLGLAQTYSQFYPDQASGDTAHFPYWIQMSQDPDANFFQTQRAFEIYWKGRNDYKGNGWKAFKRWEYINKFRVGPDGRLPAAGSAARIFEQYKQEHQYDSPNGNWSELGPTTLPANATSQPNGMGRINCVAFDPVNPTLLYAGAPSGGLWKTPDEGVTWIPLTDFMPTLGVSAILVHPANPSHLMIGTGDRDHGDAPGMGVYKSPDGGVTWNPSNNGLGNYTVGMLILHPSNPNIILAATSNGIYKSIDGGLTWLFRSSNNYHYKDIRYKPGDPSIVYATAGGQFYRSSNGGDTWSLINSGMITGNRMVIGVSPAQPNYVYLLQTNGPFAGLLRSTDSGLNFSVRSTSPNIMDYNCDGSGMASQAWYDLCIAVDPNNAEIVYTGGINIWKSTDGGSSWTINSHWVGSDWGYSCAPSVHADIHSLDWSPLNGKLYTGTDGGVYLTSTGGAAWTDISAGLAIAQVYKIGQSATNGSLTMNGYQDNGTAKNIGTGFTTVIGGDGMECIVDYSDPDFCYGELYFGNIRRSTGGGFSTIAGNGTNGIYESGGWITPYILHETNPNVMFAGYNNVWRTNNVKDSYYNVYWNPVSSGETSECDVLEQSPANPDILYVSRGSILQRSDNANDANPSWTAVTNPGGYYISDLEAHPGDPDIIYATCGTHVYKSVNKGVSWADISGTLPDIFINCIVFDVNSNEGLYIGTQTGVFYKNAGMPDWALFNSNLPHVDVRELEIFHNMSNPVESKLKAATYGRGLWESDLNLSGLFFVAPLTRELGPMPDTTFFSVFSSDPWMAWSNQPWCTVTPSGTGNDTIDVTVFSNPGANSRTAIITLVNISGDTATVTVEQRGLLPPSFLQASTNRYDIHLSWLPPMTGNSTELVFDDGTAENGWAINPGYTVWLGNYFPIEQTVSGIISSFKAYFMYNGNKGGEHVKIDVFNSSHVLIGSTGFFDPPDDTWITVSAGNIAFDGPFYAMVKWNNLSTATNWMGSDENGAYVTQNLAWYTDGSYWDYLSAAASTNPSVFLLRAIAFLENDGPVLLAAGGTEPVFTESAIRTRKQALVSLSGYGDVPANSNTDQPDVSNQPVNTAPGTSSPLMNHATGLSGYKVYRNGTFINLQPHEDSTSYDDHNLQPGTYSYQVTAQYDLTPYGYPGQSGESAPAGPVQVTITDTIHVGNGIMPCDYPYTTYWSSGRTQLLYKASELTAAGMSAGIISAIGFNVISFSSQVMEGFNLKMGQTSLNFLSAWADTLETYFSGYYQVPGTGWNYIQLSEPFSWDGTSNIIAEICFANYSYTDNSLVYGSLLPGGIRGHCMDYNWSECSQTLFNTGSATPRANISFVTTSVVLFPDQNRVGPQAGTTTFYIKGSGPWSALSHQSWCTVTPSGIGNGTITATFTQNASSTPRVATITVTAANGLTYAATLTQGGVLPPTALQGLISEKNVILSWNAPSDATGLTGYNIYRQGLKINLTPVTGVQYTDSSLQNGDYKYSVTALYGSLESSHAGPVNILINNVIVIGSGTSSVGYPYYTYFMGSRTQMLYLASEMGASGMNAGYIYSLGFNVSSFSTQVMQNFTIRMGMTTENILSGWTSSEMTVVYSGTYSVPGTGWRDITLAVPFTWNGTSNIIIEICFGNNGSYTNNSLVAGTAVANRVWHHHQDNYAGCSGTASGSTQTILPDIRFQTDTAPMPVFEPPTNLTATANGNNILLAWNAPATGTGLLGYYVYRGSTLVTPVPVTGSSYSDQGLANGSYIYTVTAAYPLRESTPAGPATAAVALTQPPVNLIAGTGFKSCVPLNWLPPVSDQPGLSPTNQLSAELSPPGDATSVTDYYRIYRRTGTTGVFSLIGTTQNFLHFIPATCFVDNTTEPGTTYFYKVTAVTSGIESNFSNIASSVPSMEGYSKTAAYSEEEPIIDGVINEAEWYDAISFPITNTLGLYNLPSSEPSFAYFKKVGNNLCIAVKDMADLTNDDDELGIYFDNNQNTVFDGTDGNFWLFRSDTSTYIQYRSISGTFPYDVNFGSVVTSPPGVSGGLSMHGGHREYEVMIDLVNSALHPVNDAFGHYIFAFDQSPGFTGIWPAGNVWCAPQSYARMNAIATPSAAPVTTAATVNALPNTLVTVPVTVTGFNDVTAFVLRLQYNPLVIGYAGFANTAQALSGLTVTDVHLGPVLHKLVISWNSSVPKDLATGAKLLDIIFSYQSGSSLLTWNNTANDGLDCQYFGPAGEALPDIPTSEFYINGLVQGMPGVVNVGNMTVENGEYRCFDATQILNIAGNGTSFTVKTGGQATLIAGQRISLFPGTTVQHSGYLLAYITTDGIYCNTLPVPPPEILTSTFVPDKAFPNEPNSGWVAYPNPTTGKVTLAFDPGRDWGEIHVTVLNMMGENIHQEVLQSETLKVLSLENQPAGVYLLRIKTAVSTGLVKIIRY